MNVWLAKYRGFTESVHISKASAIKANEKDRQQMMKDYGTYKYRKHWTVEMKRVRFTP